MFYNAERFVNYAAKMKNQPTRKQIIMFVAIA
jgi:hypothetical protein